MLLALALSCAFWRKDESCVVVVGFAQREHLIPDDEAGMKAVRPGGYEYECSERKTYFKHLSLCNLPAKRLVTRSRKHTRTCSASASVNI